MDDEGRFDALVGLIYDSAYGGLDPGLIVEAIESELGALGARIAPEIDSQRQLLVSFVSQMGGLESGHAPLQDAPTSDLGPLLSDDLGNDAPAERLLRRLSPHLARSATLRSRLRQLESRDAIHQAEVGVVPFGMVWVGADLQVLATNPRADLLLQAGDGLVVTGERLGASFTADAERLERALRGALDPAERHSRLMAVRRPAQALPLLLSIIPASTAPLANPVPTGPVALVILQNPGEAAIELEHLQAIYGFTAAERRLAEALLNNETLESFAEQTHVSRHTARSHLARLFVKTGTSRQAELVRLLMLAQPRT